MMSNLDGDSDPQVRRTITFVDSEPNMVLDALKYYKQDLRHSLTIRPMDSEMAYHTRMEIDMLSDLIIKIGDKYKCSFRQFKELLQNTPYGDDSNYWDEYLFVLDIGTGSDVDVFLTNLYNLLDKEQSEQVEPELIFTSKGEYIMSSIVKACLEEDTSGETDELVCEIIAELLGLPGVTEAVLEAARKLEWDIGIMTELMNEPTVNQIPAAFLWDYLQSDDPEPTLMDTLDTFFK